MTDQRYPAPTELANAGRRLWIAIVADVPEDVEFDARELAILHTACRQADMVAQLETALKKDGVVVAGASGQRRLNGTVTELRQSRLALARLLGELGLPDEIAQPETAATRRARRAAESRWRTPPTLGADQGVLGNA